MDYSKSVKYVRHLFKKCKLSNSRSLIVILGSEGYNQVSVLHDYLSRGKTKELSILWCYNSLSNIKKPIWKCENGEEKHIEPNVSYLPYDNTEKVLHQCFHMAILQEFEDITPASMAHIFEIVKGGGSVVFLSNNIKDLTCKNDKCSSETSLFVKRLCSTFSSCPNCIVLDDKLNIIIAPSVNSLNVSSSSADNEELCKMKSDFAEDAVINPLIQLCQTQDQARLLVKFIESLKKKVFHSTVSASSSKGRGKSAALGLAIAAAISLNYSNIFISSSCHDNVKIVFRFLFKGLDALNYKEDQDYDLIQSVNPKFKNALIGINVFRDHPQAVRFILPNDVEGKLDQAELVVVDEAASIPVMLLKNLLGPYVVLMASSTKGFGATGHSLYEDMIQEIRRPSSLKGDDKLFSSVSSGSNVVLEKFILNEPINYTTDDDIETWISRLLCLDYSISANLSQGCPEPQQCNLYYICKETLFSYENYAEKFLNQLMSLFLCTKRVITADCLYKITNDDNCHIFCLLTPFDQTKNTNPEILCAIMVHVEHQIPCNITYSGINQDVPLCDCFNGWKSITKDNTDLFLDKSGIHILDIVTHPEYRKMGYGLRAFQLLQEFFENKCIHLDETPFSYSISNNKQPHSSSESESKPVPLLLSLTEVEVDKAEFFTIFYNLNTELLRFWKKAGFTPIFISKDKNFAGEHLCTMLKPLDDSFSSYLQESWRCFMEYYSLLLSSELKGLSSSFALNILHCKYREKVPSKALSKEDIDIYLNPRRMKSLEKYCLNLGDLHCIIPCIPILTKLFFRKCFPGIVLTIAQEVILLSFGLQHKTIDEISKELNLPSSQVHGLLNRTIRKMTSYLSRIIEETIEQTIKAPNVDMAPIAQSLDEELEEAAMKIKMQQIEETKKLKDTDFSEYAIKGSEDDWEKALHTGRKTLVSIKSIKRAVVEEGKDAKPTKNQKFKGKHKFKKRKM